MGAKGSVEAAKMNSDSWGQHIEVCYNYFKETNTREKNWHINEPISNIFYV